MKLHHLLLAMLVQSVFGANAGAADSHDALAAFHWICVDTQAKLPVIEKMAIRMGAKSVPDALLAGDAAIAEHGGKGFFFERDNYQFIALATTIGSCSFVAPLLPERELVSRIESNYSLAKRTVETSGPHVRYLYQIVEPSSHAGAYILLAFPKEESRGTIFTIGFITADAAVKLHIQ